MKKTDEAAKAASSGAAAGESQTPGTTTTTQPSQVTGAAGDPQTGEAEPRSPAGGPPGDKPTETQLTGPGKSVVESTPPGPIVMQELRTSEPSLKAIVTRFAPTHEYAWAQAQAMENVGVRVLTVSDAGAGGDRRYTVWGRAVGDVPEEKQAEALAVLAKELDEEFESIRVTL